MRSKILNHFAVIFLFLGPAVNESKYFLGFFPGSDNNNNTSLPSQRKDVPSHTDSRSDPDDGHP